MRALATITMGALLTAPAMADPAEIVSAEAVRSGDAWRISVTLRHDDTGWDDYADGWRVLLDGEVLGTRVLAHPHVTEQPFTRSGTVEIPVGTATVEIEASTNVGGWEGERLRLELPEG